MTTARDATRRAIKANAPAWRTEWRTDDGKYEYVSRVPFDDESAADAVLAVLGIPATATVDDVRAGLAVVRSMESHWTEGGPTRLNANGGYVFAAAGVGWRYGASPAAAVLALAAKLEAER